MNRRTAIKGTLAAVGTLWAGKAIGQTPAGPPPGLKFRSRTRFNDQWRFSRGDVAGAEQPSFDDSAWRSLTLPHDWSIEGPFDVRNPSGIYGGFTPGGIGWYRKSFVPPALNGRQRVLIEFEGVYRNSLVWLNGDWIGARPNGFASFEYDLTDSLLPGQPNVLAVRADNSHQPNLRWYSGSGIYRHVWLTVADRMRVDYRGTYITTPKVSSDQASIRVVTTLKNSDSAFAGTQLDTLIFDGQGRLVGDAESVQAVPGGSKLDVTQDFTLQLPNLWSPENPNLYTAYSLVRQDGDRVDDYVSSFGIRDVRFDPNAGLLLNGNAVKLKGVCIHQDLGCLGVAAHDRAIERRLAALQSIGCNAIRVAHNPPAPYFLDACDRMGFLVIDEAFDKWFGHFAEGDFGSPGWDEWWQEDLRAMLVRDRNHPSVILWSVGNENGVPGSDEHDSTLKQLVDFVHTAEPSRPATCALRPQTEGTLEDFANAVARSAALMDVLALNYQEQYMDLYRAKIPGVAMLSSESYPFFRGVTNGFEAVNCWWDVVKKDYDAGQFVWSGIDYLGETAAWPSKGWPNGLIDTCGFVKPRAAFHQTVWRGVPSVKISIINDNIDLDLGLPVWRWPKSAAHWNFTGLEGQVMLVNTVSNCETVEVVVNGASYGQQQPVLFPNLTIFWYVPYASGRVEAIGRIGGKIVTRDLLQTAGRPVTITLQPERYSMAADGIEVLHIEVTLLDAAGIIVPDHDVRLGFAVSGPAKLIGLDNGDLRSLEPYQGNVRTTYQGRALAVIQSTGAPGVVALTALIDGVAVVTTAIRAIA